MNNSYIVRWVYILFYLRSSFQFLRLLEVQKSKLLFAPVSSTLDWNTQNQQLFLLPSKLRSRTYITVWARRLSLTHGEKSRSTFWRLWNYKIMLSTLWNMFPSVITLPLTKLIISGLVKIYLVLLNYILVFSFLAVSITLNYQLYISLNIWATWLFYSQLLQWAS